MPIWGQTLGRSMPPARLLAPLIVTATQEATVWLHQVGRIGPEGDGANVTEPDILWGRVSDAAPTPPAASTPRLHPRLERVR